MAASEDQYSVGAGGAQLRATNVIDMLSSEEDEQEEGNGQEDYDAQNDDDENDAAQPEKLGSETMAAGGSVRSFSAGSPDKARTDPEPAGTLTPVQAPQVLRADTASAFKDNIEPIDQLV